MRQHEREEFKQLLDDIGDAMGTPESRIDRAKRVYFEHLEDIPIEKIRRAAITAIRTLNTFPTINQLRTFGGGHDDNHRREAELEEAKRRLDRACQDKDVEYARELECLIGFLEGKRRPHLV